jgi:hypothetical protein
VLAEAYNGTMRRRLALVCGLILVGGLSAGCGGGSQAAVRQEAKQLLGDGNPKILRIENVRDLAGNQLVIATLKGRFRFPLPNGPCSEQCRKALRTPRSHVWLSFLQSQPKEMYGFNPTTASEILAIDNAHSARKYFSVFPHSDAAILCAIPRGHSSATVPGHCSTTLVGPSLDGSSHVTAIRFHEAWKFTPPPPLGFARQTRAGGWIVSLDRNEHVQSIRQFGDIPPQLWK